MLSWIFKKLGRNASPAAATPSAPYATGKHSSNTAVQVREAERAAEHKATQKSQQLAAAKAEWEPRLQAALGDDAALLALAQSTPLLDIKLGAVQALNGEAALKQAEREFRSHDRRVHRVAKTRLEAAVAQREARAKAETLIASALALNAQTDLPVNVLLDLDRDWRALEPELLEPIQIEQFRGLSDALNSQLRQRSELEQQLQRWSAEANKALLDARSATEQVAVSGRAGDLLGHAQALAALQSRRPDPTAVPSSNAIVDKLDAALCSISQVEARLTCLESVDEPAESVVVEPVDVDAASPTQAPAALARPSTKQRWQALEPVADGGLAGLLDQRFEQWLRAQAPVPAALDVQAPAAGKPSRSAEARKRPSLSPASPQQEQLFLSLLEQAEAAQAAGLLNDMQQQLSRIEEALEGVNPASLAEGARVRQQALQMERSRLRDWEQWGGARALDALVAEAEELASFTLAATEPVAIEESDPQPVLKLNLKAHREAIQALRKRWKEVDRLSAGAGQALWQRFDTAMQTANQPVAAQLAELKIAREANLASRELLLNQLDTVPVASANGEPALIGEVGTAHWKECLRALSDFQLAWRQLGPLEHTVPLVNREALLRRQRASLERIEAPLQQARRVAEAQRLVLIERAEALLQELRGNSQIRDLTQRVRDLQAEWQQQARGLPLARAIENDLWARFKAATDAVFAQRSAAFDARDEALAASLAEYEALLARLEALSAETADVEIRRTLAEVDRAWRQGGDLPRHQAGALDSRLQAAHASALQILAGRGQLIWRAQCEALAAKLSLCELNEGSTARPDEAEFAARWAALPALPEAWEQALARRTPANADLDPLLLQLEAALDMPASAEMQAARRLLKLKAMKDALEGRGSQQSAAEQQAACMSTLLQASNASPAQVERLHALVKTLAQAPAGTWLAPTGGR
ncbi:MAG: DUF349 domain-containing protein [Paucibacter sp.]|nr:DUF349 domain-containing protein [Roseateles sp.]